MSKEHDEEKELKKDTQSDQIEEEMVDDESSVDQLSEEDFEALKQENEALKAELEQKNDQLLRRIAEFDNYRRRTQKERIALFDDAKFKALEAFLPIFDDLERTLTSVKEEGKTPFIQGVELIRNKFQNILDQHGLERIDEAGIPFDVNFHDALMRQPSADDSVESDTVLQVLESGYKVGDRVIRHAKVIVSE